jgi:hypothetical protein
MESRNNQRQKQRLGIAKRSPNAYVNTVCLNVNKQQHYGVTDPRANIGARDAGNRKSNARAHSRVNDAASVV